MTSLGAKLEKKQQELKAGQRSPHPHFWVMMMCRVVCTCVFPQTMAAVLCRCGVTCLLHLCPCVCPLDHSTLLLHLKHFPLDLQILTCQLAFYQSNGRTGMADSRVSVSSRWISFPSALLFPQAQNAVPLTGWSMGVAATGFLGLG